MNSVPTKVRIVGALLLLGGLSYVVSGLQIPAPANLMAMLVGALGVAMGIHLLARGAVEWIERVLLLCLVLGVITTVLQLPLLLKEPTLIITTVIAFGIEIWCWTVVSADVGRVHRGKLGRSRAEAEAVTAADSTPSFMRAAASTAEPAAAPVTQLPSPGLLPVAQPAVLLHLQQPLDATGFGGWVVSNGSSMQLQASPPPGADAQLLACDEAGTWTEIPAPDAASGMATVQLPAGNWYLMLRSPAAAGASTILYVTGAPTLGFAAAA